METFSAGSLEGFYATLGAAMRAAEKDNYDLSLNASDMRNFLQVLNYTANHANNRSWRPVREWAERMLSDIAITVGVELI